MWIICKSVMRMRGGMNLPDSCRKTGICISADGSPGPATRVLRILTVVINLKVGVVSTQ
jgi:hypothetical protein